MNATRGMWWLQAICFREYPQIRLFIPCQVRGDSYTKARSFDNTSELRRCVSGDLWTCEYIQLRRRFPHIAISVGGRANTWKIRANRCNRDTRLGQGVYIIYQKVTTYRLGRSAIHRRYIRPCDCLRSFGLPDIVLVVVASAPAGTQILEDSRVRLTKIMGQFTKRQWLTLIVISIADFANAVCVSLQAPFYPQEVSERWRLNVEARNVNNGGCIFVPVTIFGKIDYGMHFMYA